VPGSASIRRLLVLAAAATTAAGACTTVTYQGPRRPSVEVATIEARDFAIESLDGADMREAHRKLEVLPGAHRLVVRLSTTRDYYVMRVYFHAEPIDLCVDALPGHYYTLAARAGWKRYAPTILDGSSDVSVPPCE
jgi:hypothetical protein